MQMLNKINIIKAINKSLEPFFIKEEGGAFLLTPQKVVNTFRLRISNDNSSAYDSYGKSGETVSVVRWFSNFWLFVDIAFPNPNSAIISLSIFQGEETDLSKVQLFRAEWDDYGDGGSFHAQPHWHFMTNKAIEDTVSSFAEMAPETKDTFAAVLNDEKSKTIDLSKFHFAMNGDWANSKLHVHRINEEKELADWFGGLLGYLKTELEFVEIKSNNFPL
jgi:hypothetical protein